MRIYTILYTNFEVRNSDGENLRGNHFTAESYSISTWQAFVFI